ncbi:MAG: sedoheptulokinase [Sedimentisphaeraceae bacterium JB056]
MATVISLDIGTSKICAAAYNTEKECLTGCISIENDSRIKENAEGSYEQCSEKTIELIFSAISLLLKSDAVKSNDVTDITVTGQMHGILLVNDQLKPVTNFITWRDQKAASIAISIGENYAKSNGCGLRTGYGGATLAYLNSRAPLDGNLKALSISDYLCAKLTGTAATEPTHAASWGIYDIKSRQWNKQILNELGIPEKILPDIKPTSEIIGNILPQIAERFGLKREAKVYSPIGDNQAAVIGARGKAKEAAVLNLGTGGQISIPHNKSDYVEGFETRPMPDGSFILVGASICGGWTYAYLKDFFKDVIAKITGIAPKDEAIYDKMNSFLSENKHGSAIKLDPRFCGTRANPDLRGRITAINAENFTPSELTRSFAYAMVEELYDMIPPACLEDFSCVMAGGNAMRKNPALLSITEEILKKPVNLANVKEEAATGAAMAAMKG